MDVKIICALSAIQSSRGRGIADMGLTRSELSTRKLLPDEKYTFPANFPLGMRQSLMLTCL